MATQRDEAWRERIRQESRVTGRSQWFSPVHRDRRTNTTSGVDAPRRAASARAQPMSYHEPDLCEQFNCVQCGYVNTISSPNSPSMGYKDSKASKRVQSARPMHPRFDDIDIGSPVSTPKTPSPRVGNAWNSNYESPVKEEVSRLSRELKSEKMERQKLERMLQQLADKQSRYEAVVQPEAYTSSPYFEPSKRDLERERTKPVPREPAPSARKHYLNSMRGYSDNGMPDSPPPRRLDADVDPSTSWAQGLRTPAPRMRRRW